MSRAASGSDRATVATAVAELGGWASSLTWTDAPSAARARLELVLLDSLGVMVLGATAPEQRALVQAWRPVPGRAPLIGGGMSTSTEAAAWLNAVALVRYELDEGHKYAKGHPGAHVLPAVLALATDLDASGPDTAAALLAGYEVAARFGRATRMHSGAHPHGSWGVAGAAAGCARLLGLSPDGVAAAIDAGSGLPVAGHFDSALEGNPVRDSWMGAANVAGLAAARLAAAGQARNTGTASGSLGTLLGDFDPGPLTDALGVRWEIELGYFKRHAACSFTHPVADALLSVRDEIGEPARIASVLVETHSLAVGLDRTSWDSRLGALFSIPFVAATAVLHGRVDPGDSDPGARDDPAVRALAGRVTLRLAADLDARLPDERPARVTVLTEGRECTATVPNPIGDAAHHPFDRAGVEGLLRGWIRDDAAVATLTRVVDSLPNATRVGPLLAELAELSTPSAAEES
ncbi:MAG: MmgE/PrpD family protein [Actinomycetota bacterium]|nr:MmgE/PrpD family protein [Actinomycetota bacterium]